MSQRFFLFGFLVSVLLLCGCKEDESIRELELLDVFVGLDRLNISGTLNANVQTDAIFTLSFANSIDTRSVSTS